MPMRAAIVKTGMKHAVWALVSKTFSEFYVFVLWVQSQHFATFMLEICAFLVFIDFAGKCKATAILFKRKHSIPYGRGTPRNPEPTETERTNR